MNKNNIDNLKYFKKEDLILIIDTLNKSIDYYKLKIDKVLDFINVWKDNKTELKVSMLDLLIIEDILRGEDNE